MQYPKKSSYTFIQLSEYDCRQINVHKGRVYNYWWIEPNEKPIKLRKGEIPKALVDKDLGELGDI